MYTQVDTQDSEIMWSTAREFHGTTLAQYTSHGLIDTESILIKSKYRVMEIIETNKKALGGEIHMHWN